MVVKIFFSSFSLFLLQISRTNAVQGAAALWRLKKKKEF